MPQMIRPRVPKSRLPLASWLLIILVATFSLVSVGTTQAIGYELTDGPQRLPGPAVQVSSPGGSAADLASLRQVAESGHGETSDHGAMDGSHDVDAQGTDGHGPLSDAIHSDQAGQGSHGEMAHGDGAHGDGGHGTGHGDSSHGEDGHGGEGHGNGGHGGHGDAPHVAGDQLVIFWGVPFAGILLSIALFPLIAPHFWHRRYGAVAAGWAVLFLAPFALIEGWDVALYELLHIVLLDYVPFIILLGTLFVVAGGVRVRGALRGTPAVNTGIIAIGTGLASIMGTTGAAMLLIRPLVRANEYRRSRVHIVVFFIFLVANIGGSLTPLGDPPLFLGFLHGVDFFWVTTNLILPMAFMAACLLSLFFILDTFMLRREAAYLDPPEVSDDHAHGRTSGEPLGLEGTVNLLLLLGVMASVLLQGVWKTGISVDIYHVPISVEVMVANLLLMAIAALSLLLTPWESRRRNAFTWFPIIEVAKLFAGIFITIIPVLAMLKAGLDGPMAGIVALVSDNGEPINAMYFWITGILSSFLDNAPTYLVFFNTAGGDAALLMNQLPTTLLAISAGAVFMGANTYIGNAPNFMVRSIAEERGVNMPSFFGYMVWSFGILVPLFVVVTFLFFL